MLKLSFLEMAGFKSFADRVRLPFENGITCIVGPNGCGKSNLSDAIGWVLGSQSAQSLRGQKMEDFIFSGTRRRKPSGFVEATLAFSRTDGGMIELKELGFSAEVLEIGRKLYRSGESVYSLNDRRCRLKDIHAVLEEAGLGFSSYALIAQGRIGWFLSAKSLERRAVIEEAARITGYKSRRRAATLKLEMAQQNLVRVNDIIGEIERQLRSLKRQAGKARRYAEVRDQFQRVERLRFVFEAERLFSGLETVETALKELRERSEALESRLEQGEEAHRRELERRERLESRLAGSRERLAGVRLEIDRAENTVAYQRERIESIERALKVREEEQSRLRATVGKVEEELVRFQQEEEELEGEGERIEAALGRQSEMAKRCSHQLGETEERVEELRRSLLSLAARRAALGNLKEQLERELASARVSLERLERERAGHLLELEEARRQLRQTGRTLTGRQQEKEELEGALAVRREAAQLLESQQEELGREVVDLRTRMVAQQERLQSLEEIEVSHSNYSEGVQRFLNHLGRSSDLHTEGTLADRIETRPQYERLVEEFLERELEYVLVGSLEDALRGVSALKTLESGRCTFLSMGSSNGFGRGAGTGPNVEYAPEKGIYGTLGSLLEMAPEVENAFQRVLPQRAQAIVVRDLDCAFSLAHSYPENTFITLEGDALTPRGLLRASAGGSRKLGLLSLKRQKREIEERIRTLATHLAEREELLEDVSRKRAAALELVAECQDSINQIEKELIGLTHQSERIGEEERRQVRALEVIGREMEELRRQEEQEKSHLAQVEAEFSAAQRSHAEAEGLLAESLESLEQLKKDRTRMEEQLHLISSNHKVIAERRRALQQTLERVGEQRESLRARLESNLEASRQAQAQKSEIKRELEALARQLRELQQGESRLRAGIEAQEKEYAGWKESFPRAERELEEVRQRRSRLQEEKGSLEVERARLETQLQNLSLQCQEALGMALTEAAQGVETENLDREATVRQYRELKEKLERFGPINMAALEEYREAEERHGFLLEQRQDIETSIADTSRAIQEINRRSRQKFREAFQAINVHFNDIFQKLFGGGEAGMRLLDEADLLESGIDIFAQPPGKKLQNVTLLSGGEKAMTVFALLMALFSYHPSRFCVLDEVDAPLDDANVRRFADLVEEMSAHTQFIVISHNKLTMRKAASLYGVTMQEPGVSKVVSVQFESTLAQQSA